MAHVDIAPRPSQPTAIRHDVPARFAQGQLVEIRSAPEIAATLDVDGKLDGVPFMPEMARYCGQSFRVFRRADITCVEGHGLRRMNAAVFLDELRCDGSAHDACERHCLIFWKEAWLKPAGSVKSPLMAETQSLSEFADSLGNLPTRKDGRYSCQSTALAAATTELPEWKLLPYIWQIRAGELTLARSALLIARTVLNRLRRFAGLMEIGRLAGPKSKSSNRDLRLRPGEWVTVRSHAEIRQTLDPAGRNRGMAFEPEMSGYSGKCFQVAFPVKNLIREETGEMVHPAGTVALSGVICRGLCTKNCPRTHYWFWREDWLDRAPLPDKGLSAASNTGRQTRMVPPVGRTSS